MFVFFFQAEDGIRDLVRSRGLGDVYKRQGVHDLQHRASAQGTVAAARHLAQLRIAFDDAAPGVCLLYTSDAADERSSVDLGGRRIIKKKKTNNKRSRRSHSDLAQYIKYNLQQNRQQVDTQHNHINKR